MQSQALSFKSATKKTSGGTTAQQSSTSSKRHLAGKVIDAPSVSPATAATPTTRDKEKPYAKPGVSKGCRCGKLGHRSNEYPKGGPSAWQTTRIRTRC